MKKLLLLTVITGLSVLFSPVFSQFSSNFQLVCPGSPVKFIADDSTITTHAWQFPGGSPSTSSSATPTVTYSAEGVYNVLLSINGNSPVQFTDYITVKAGRTLMSRKVDDHWIFGAESFTFNKNHLEFSNDNFTGISHVPQPTSFGGYGMVSNISNPSGQFLFRIDDNRIVNRHNKYMLNGTSLIHQTGSGYVDLEQNVVVPVPGACERKYYIFHHDIRFNPAVLYYSIVDMDGDNGLGEVISANNLINIPDSVGDALTATFNCQLNGVWIITHSKGTNPSKFWAIHLGPGGVLSTPTSYPSNFSAGGSGRIKISPSGEYLAGPNSPTHIWRFDKNNGAITMGEQLEQISGYSNQYDACEWSQDGQNVYFSKFWSTLITQYTIGDEVTPGVLKAKQFDIAPYFQGYYVDGVKMMELGSDNRIYCSARNSAPIADNELVAINNPDVRIVNNHTFTHIPLPTVNSMAHWSFNNGFVSKTLRHFDALFEPLEEEYVLTCNTDKVTIEMQEGMNKYLWVDPGFNVIGTSNSITLTEVGEYYLFLKEHSYSCETARKFNVVAGYDTDIFRKSYMALTEILPVNMTKVAGNDGYAMLYRNNAQTQFGIERFDEDGNSVWKYFYSLPAGSTYYYHAWNVEMIATDNGFGVLVGNSNKCHFLRIDLSGNILWVKEIQPDLSQYTSPTISLTEADYSTKYDRFVLGGYIRESISSYDTKALIVILNGDGSINGYRTYFQPSAPLIEYGITDVKCYGPADDYFSFCGLNGNNLFVCQEHYDLNGLSVYQQAYSDQAYVSDPTLNKSVWSYPISNYPGLTVSYKTNRFSGNPTIYESVIHSFANYLQGGADFSYRYRLNQPQADYDHFHITDIALHYTARQNPSVPDSAGYIVKADFNANHAQATIQSQGNALFYLNADLTISDSNVYVYGIWVDGTEGGVVSIVSESGTDPDGYLYSVTSSRINIDYELTKYRKSNLSDCGTVIGKLFAEEISNIPYNISLVNGSAHILESGIANYSKLSLDDTRSYCCDAVPTYIECQNGVISFDIDSSDCDSLAILNVSYSGGNLAAVIWEANGTLFSTSLTPTHLKLPTGETQICVKVLFDNGCMAEACKTYRSGTTMEVREIITCKNPHFFMPEDCQTYYSYQMVDHDPSDDQWSNYNYNSLTDPTYGGPGCAGWISHGLIPGHYTINFFSEAGCLQHILELDVVPGTPKSYVKDIYLCPLPPNDCVMVMATDSAYFPCQPNNGMFDGHFTDNTLGHVVTNSPQELFCFPNFVGVIGDYSFTTKNSEDGCPCTVSGNVYTYEDCAQIPDGDPETSPINGIGRENFENSKGRLAVYPNPSSGNFNVDYRGDIQPGATLLITDVLGKSIKIMPLVSNTIVDLSQYPSGVYLIRVTNGEVVESQHVVRE